MVEDFSIFWYWIIIEKKLKEENWLVGKLRVVGVYFDYIDCYLLVVVWDMYVIGVLVSIMLV